MVVLYVKNKNTNFLETTQQTKNIREETNQKIRVLGYKYYNLKNLFDRMCLKRDDLFIYGKQLEEKFKQIKNGIKLQNTKKRMKDALICWFSENFYDEIFEPNSIILKQLNEISVNSQMTSKPNKTQPTTKINKTKPTTKIQKQKVNIEIQNDISLIKEPIYNNFIDFKANQETDSYEVSNVIQRQCPHNINFDFDTLLHF